MLYPTCIVLGVEALNGGRSEATPVVTGNAATAGAPPEEVRAQFAGAEKVTVAPGGTGATRG
jgi:hypothetical protein